MKNSSKIFWGLLFIFLGGIMFLDRWAFINIDLLDLIWKLWPVILIVIGIDRILYKNARTGVVVSLIGLLLLANNLFDFNIWIYFWPILFVVAGLYIILKDDKSSEERVSTSNVSTRDRINESAVFWGVEKRLVSDNFTGGKIDVVFGAYDLDLSEVKVAKGGAKLEVNAVFGGADIIVPQNCRVVTNGNGVFGGWDTKLKERDIEKPVLEIFGTALFGGVDIKETKSKKCC